jgi:lysophospholipase L1-like esterase
MKKSVIYTFIFILTSMAAFSQSDDVKINSSYQNWYYRQRMDLYENVEEHRKYDIVFLGNSITERGEWAELFPGKMVANRGIGGDNTFGVIARLDNVIKLNPDKLYILIGINDLGRGLPVDVVANNYKIIIRNLKDALPKTSIYVQSVLPLNEDVLKYDYLKGKEKSIKELNRRIKALAGKEKLTFINLHGLFADENGKLKSEWTPDGIHLQPAAYAHWVDFLKRMNFL